jgi:methylated-DNA-[protein]-cysteine S-methyltransferase
MRQLATAFLRRPALLSKLRAKGQITSVQQIYYTYMESPVGNLLLAGSVGGLEWICFKKSKGAVEPQPHWQPSKLHFTEAIRQLDAYFNGALKTFDLPLAPEGTPFQKTVWRELLKVPYATTVSYAEIARRIGKPTAVRAVGAANGCNPLPIVVPCHRVIGSDGRLTGYGGGLAVKQFLLALERGSNA